jgi:hypothetical protein
VSEGKQENILPKEEEGKWALREVAEEQHL